MRAGCVRGAIGAVLIVLTLSSCGTPAPSPSTTPRPTSSALPRPSAAAGACASVTTTTAIDQVPAACATLWAPYGVTKVPPANLTDSTPAPPLVVNATNGAVSDADARAWALAANRTSVWLRWSEANGQAGLTTHVEGTRVINATIDQLMRAGVAVREPDCDLFANRYGLFPITPSGKGFLTSLGEVTMASFVLVGRYTGPCSLTAQYPDGRLETLFPAPGEVTTILAGSLRHDPLLGDLWFVDAGSVCSNPGAPVSWCR